MTTLDPEHDPASAGASGHLGGATRLINAARNPSRKGAAGLQSNDAHLGNAGGETSALGPATGPMEVRDPFSHRPVAATHTDSGDAGAGGQQTPDALHLQAASTRSRRKAGGGGLPKGATRYPPASPHPSPSGADPACSEALPTKRAAGSDTASPQGADETMRPAEPCAPGVSSDTSHRLPERGGRGRTSFDAPGADAAPDILPQLRALWRRRQQWHSAEKKLTLQAAAICRGFCDGDKKAAGKMLARVESGSDLPDDMLADIAIRPLLNARDGIRTDREGVERTLKKMVKPLPIYPWAKEVYGFGELSLAALIGEAMSDTADDIGAYRTVSGLWKRFGLAVIAGERQRKCADADKALVHAYSPRRRSVMWNVGNGLIGCMGLGPRPFVGEEIAGRDDWSPYQKLFVERLRVEAERSPDDAREPAKDAKTGLLRESFSKAAAARAKRYVEKRFLCDLWVAWRAVSP